MVKVKDYPKEKYSAYFEVVDEGSEMVARIYDRKTGKVTEHRSKGSPDSWVKTEMAKHKRAT